MTIISRLEREKIGKRKRQRESMQKFRQGSATSHSFLTTSLLRDKDGKEEEANGKQSKTSSWFGNILFVPPGLQVYIYLSIMC